MRLTYKEPKVYGGYNATNTDECACVIKLGQLEDVLEKYKIDTPQELDKDLEMCHRLVYEYGQIEDELGIDLVTLFKAFRYGIYVKTHKYNDYVSPQDLRGTLGWEYILDFANKEDHSHPYEVKLIFGRTGICLTSRSYGKTWALTKEELL